MKAQLSLGELVGVLTTALSMDGELESRCGVVERRDGVEAATCTNESEVRDEEGTCAPHVLVSMYAGEVK